MSTYKPTIQLQAELVLYQKRYTIALSFVSDIVFDYVATTNQIINYPGAAARYVLPDVVAGVPEAMISARRIRPKSVESFRRLYKRINNREPLSKEIIITIDNDDQEIVNEFTIVNIFDDRQVPIHAIGAIKDVTW